MAPSFRYLSTILNNPSIFLFYDYEDPSPGEFQYLGLHFLTAIHYAVKLASKNNDATFSDGLPRLEESARDCWFEPYGNTFERWFDVAHTEIMLSAMTSFLTEIKEFFAIQKLHQYSWDITPTTVDIVASFIEFLVDALEKSSSPSCPWIAKNIGQTDILCKRLKFLIVFLRDTQLQCTEQEESKNILEEIESLANEVGIFLYSFFFTADHVTMPDMDLEISLLLAKIDALEEKIKEHFATVFQQPKITSPNLTSASIYIIDSLLDDLNHLLDQKADLVGEMKDQITTLHHELYSSRSMLRDVELQQNKDLEECEMQLIGLAYEVEYIIACFAAGEVPIWYLSLRLPSFIQLNKSIWVSLKNTKQNSGIQVAESSSEVSLSQVVVKSIPKVDEIIVGFEKKITEIANQLLGGPVCLQIISIVGMGGLGKTTLARKLFNLPNVLRRFDRRSWCVVSQTYQKRKLLIDILSSLSSLDKDQILKMEDFQLADRVYKSLKRTRYLLVVDDIWEKEAWDDLKRYFPDDTNGSRILFTSRNKDVASQVSPEPIIHDLPLLSAYECWDLLHKKVFPNSICPPKLEDVGKRIATNCKGLPLAVVGIATVLANMKKKKSLWQEVATSLSSYISKDQDILEISYRHLPSHLKSCFLSLGAFEEDKEISVRKLSSLWVSHGFIPINEERSSEDVAEDYLVELINRSMVQIVKRRPDNGIKTCTIHDLIRDMCLRIAEKEKFLNVINEKSSVHDQYAHICIHSDPDAFTSIPMGLHIRSLLGNFSDLSFITSSMKRLRILKLSKDQVYDGTTLGFLVQLRHLESAGHLRNFNSHMNLEFLCLESDIPLNMPKLRHIYFRSRYIPFYLVKSETNSLQTISRVIIEDLADEERLRRFSHLGRLKCKYDRNWNRSPNLGSLTQLISLTIRGSSRNSMPSKFELINFPINIKKLSLVDIELTGTLLSSIGTLPNLEILKLRLVQFEGKRWNTNDDEFKNLKFLELHSRDIVEWNISEEHIPLLERLVLIRCSNLKSLPCDLGYILTLQRIEVHNCGEGVINSAKQIVEDQEEAGNEQLEVIILTTTD